MTLRQLVAFWSAVCLLVLAVLEAFRMAGWGFGRWQAIVAFVVGYGLASWMADEDAKRGRA